LRIVRANALHKNHDNPANHVNPVKLTFRAKARNTISTGFTGLT
jgi:hypothetical protein